VILIGGGSLTPMLPELISDILEVPRNRVGIQIRERLKGVAGEESVNGPESITPIGIGISSLEGQGLHYFSVTVNETQVPIFELQLATVSDALLAAGISPRLLFARPGAALTFEINGEIRIVKGSFGQPAQFFLNDEPTTLDQKLKKGDQIHFSPAIDGEVARIILEDILPRDQAKEILVNDQVLFFIPEVYRDGIKVQRDSEVLDGCKIEYRTNQTQKDLLRFLDLPQELDTRIRVRVNGKEEIYSFERHILVNGEKVHEGYIINDCDEVIIQEKKLRIEDLDLQPSPILFHVNGSELIYPIQKLKVTSRGQVLSAQEIVLEGMDLRVEGYERMPIMSDLLPYIEIPQEAPPGSKLVILINNKPGEFTTVLHPGDRIEIKWVNVKLRDSL
jgi:sulfur carrier protein ThiS